jgi:transcriptional/translational regulatory protein YebC/TACO1
MNVIRIYKTDPYKGLSDYGTVDFIFDEEGEYEGLDDYDSEPYSSDVIREDTEYDHVDHNAEVVTLEEMREMKEKLDDEISELEEKRDLIGEAIRSL